MDRTPHRARKHLAGGAAACLTLGVGCWVSACSQPGAPSVPAEELTTTVARIERECLRAYPAELIARMTVGGKKGVPQDVDADPSIQPQFLDRDLDVEKGIFYPSYLAELLPAFQRYVQPGLRFLDLGSGDGRVVFLAGVLGAEAVGMEWEPELVAVSHDAMERLEDLLPDKRVRFIQGDFFDAPWSDYDVIFYFGSGSADLAAIQEKLRAEMKADARLILARENHPFPGFEAEERFPSVKVMRRLQPDE